MKKPYRHDITGLRAIAVLAVVIFHLFPKVLKGGYLGVDIFFVISGFLITGILLNEDKEKNSINLINFYKRRLIRIWPATIVLLILTSLIAYLIISFELLRPFVKSVKYSILGSANIYFYKFLDTSYFAPATNTNLLLHLWSLGVESQFYLFFPFLIILVKRKYLLYVFILLFLASLITATIISKTNFMFSYYMLPTRAFALLIGSLGAYISIYHSNLLKIFNHKIINNIIALVSIITIIVAYIFVGEKFKLPNNYTLLAIIPTIALILGGCRGNQSSLIHWFLENKIFIYVGLWSFSIYLYHWVLIALCYNIYNGQISLLVATIIFILSIILGALSYYLVERPFLKLKWHFLICFMVFIVIPFLGASVLGKITKKLDHSFSPKEYNSLSYICDPGYLVNINEKMFNSKCIVNKNVGEPNILLIGDSNAGHYVQIINKIAENLEFSFRNIIVQGCYPAGLYKDNENSYCKANIKKQLLLAKNYDILVVAGRWINDDDIENRINKLIVDLKKYSKVVIILGAIPYMDNFNARNIFNGNEFLHSNLLDVNSTDNKKVFKYNKIIKDVTSKYKNVYYIDFNDILCKENVCQYKDGRNSLYYNTKHLSVYGSEWLGEKYLEKGIDDIWYKVKALYKDRTNIKVNPDGSVEKLKKG